MKTSGNYGLKLFEGTDNVKRQDFVDNFASIDTQMKIINDNGYPSVTATGTNAYVGSTDRIKTLGKGTKLTLFVGADSTGNSTLNLNSYGAKNIKDSFGNIVNNLKANIPYNLCYNGTDFILQGKGGGGDATSGQVLSGKKVTVDSGPTVGTMPNNGAINKALTINETYTIPKGYHDGTGKVTQNIPTKGAATYNPNTSAQTISAGQYLSGNQIIAAITGTATDADVVAGKTYNSAAGILRTGKATIASLGGKRFATGTFVGSSYGTTINVGFKPTTVIVRGIYSVNDHWRISSPIGTLDANASNNGGQASTTNNNLTITSTGFNTGVLINSTAGTYICFE